jgi:hypothetical protein
MPTLMELRETASSLGLNFKAKTTKPVLESMIAEEKARRADEVNKNFVDANSTRIPPRLLRAAAPRNVPLDSEVRADHYRTTNGSNKLTPKQVKRLRQKHNRSL